MCAVNRMNVRARKAGPKNEKIGGETEREKKGEEGYESHKATFFGRLLT